MIKMNQYATTSEERENLHISTSALSTTLTISCASVIGVGAIMILRALFSTSEGDYANLGFSVSSSNKDEKGDGENKRSGVSDLRGDAQFIEMMNKSSKTSELK